MSIHRLLHSDALALALRLRLDARNSRPGIWRWEGDKMLAGIGKTLAIVLIISSAVPAAAELSPEEAAGINGAAMFFAMGTVAFAECPKAGFKVNPNGWHALVEATAPGTTAKDYFIGGRFSEVGRNSFAFVTAVETEAGAGAWCGYMAAWAKVAHPTIWQKLIAK